MQTRSKSKSVTNSEYNSDTGYNNSANIPLNTYEHSNQVNSFGNRDDQSKKPNSSALLESSESDTLKSFSRIDPNSDLYKYLNQSVSQTISSTQRQSFKTSIPTNDESFAFREAEEIYSSKEKSTIHKSNFQSPHYIVRNKNINQQNYNNSTANKSSNNHFTEKQINGNDNSSRVSDLSHFNAKTLLMQNFEDESEIDESNTQGLNSQDTDKIFSNQNQISRMQEDDTHDLESSFSKNTAAKIKFHLMKHNLENDIRSDDEEDIDENNNKFTQKDIVDVIENDMQSINSLKTSDVTSKTKTISSGSLSSKSKDIVEKQKNKKIVLNGNHQSNFMSKEENQKISSLLSLNQKKPSNSIFKKPANKSSKKIGNSISDFFSSNNDDEEVNVGLNGAIRFADFDQNLGMAPSVEGKIDRATGKLVTIEDETNNIPYGELWILDRVHRYMRLLSNPIFQFVRDTAAKTNSNTDVFLKIPDSTLSDTFNRNFNANTFFSRSNFGSEARLREQNINQIKDETERTLNETIDRNQQVIEENIQIEAQESVLNFNKEKRKNSEDAVEIQKLNEDILSLTKDINNRKRKLENIKKNIRDQFRRQNVSTLVSRLRNPERTNTIILNFLDQLQQNEDPQVRGFASALEQQAIQQFSEGLQNQGQSQVSDVRANAQRLWLLAPENLGMFFWDNRFNSAVNQANTYITLRTKRRFNTFNLMTDPIVRDLYSDLVASIIKKYRFTDGSRNLTQKRIDDNDRNIIALIRQFEIVSQGIDGQLHYGTIRVPTKDRKKRKYQTIAFNEDSMLEEQDFCSHRSKYANHNMVGVGY